jgi:hypothetical protein
MASSLYGVDYIFSELNHAEKNYKKWKSDEKKRVQLEAVK